MPKEISLSLLFLKSCSYDSDVAAVSGMVFPKKICPRSSPQNCWYYLIWEKFFQMYEVKNFEIRRAPYYQAGPNSYFKCP